MQNALLVGLSRQVALGRELDVVANNIANLNTTGFKADGAVFEEFISPTARLDNFMGADKRVSFVQDRATWLDMSQGPLERTGNSLDVAINGRGYPRSCRHRVANATHATARCRSTTTVSLLPVRVIRCWVNRTHHVSTERPQHHDQQGRHHQRARGQQCDD